MLKKRVLYHTSLIPFGVFLRSSSVFYAIYVPTILAPYVLYQEMNNQFLKRKGDGQVQKIAMLAKIIEIMEGVFFKPPV